MKIKDEDMKRFYKSDYKMSLKRRILLFIIIGWFLPIEIIFLLVFSSYRETYLQGTIRTIKEGVSSSAILVSNRLDEGIKLMQKPSYERLWEPDWRRYRAGEIGRYELFISVNDSLKQNFYLDNRFDSYAFYLYDDINTEPMCYSSRAGVTYENYMADIHPLVYHIIETDSNYVEVHIFENKVFFVRNLYTINEYERYGTLVVSMNTDKLMSGFPMQEYHNVALGLNNTEEIMIPGKPDETADAQDVFELLKEGFAPDTRGTILSVQNNTYSGYMYQRVQDSYSLGLYYIVHRSMMQRGLKEKYWIVVAVTAGLILVTLYAFRFLKKHIENPMQVMVDASKEVESGKIGTLIKGMPMPNAEFEYLAESFNNMSEQVKYLFDTVYTEQLARKDAQIAALQAQINPHFLNNTLEMMNWQARMNQDLEVSKMIEALGVVLDSSMNRSNEKTIALSEELRCADSYLYIMAMRFGQRLKVERNIDSKLLQYRVPRLILQPLLENAIIHGIEKVRQGTICLEIRREEDKLYLDILNTGTGLSLEERERIERILYGTYEPKSGDTNKHTSIGIRNVNRRIQLVYGEEYGLFISSMEDGRILSRIVIPYEEQ